MIINIPDEEFELLLIRLKVIVEHSQRLTSGNVSHIKPNIKGNAEIITNTLKEYVTSERTN